MAEKAIGPFIFPTLKAAEEEIRRVLHESPRDKDLAGADLELISNLLALHHEADEKIGAGVRSIQVRVIEYGQPGFWITRVDGTVDDFSYKKALRGAPSHQEQVNAALRAAVKDDVAEFRQRWFDEHADASGQVRCPLTDQMMTLGPWAHVDHVVSFNLIAVTFIVGYGGYDQIKIGSSIDHPGSALADAEQRASWIRWHRQHADLRVIHKSANLARQRRTVA